MEFKGNKGKWRVEDEGTLYCDDIEIVQCWVSLGQTSPTINECKANALLISKAPEMLEMLKELILDLEEVIFPTSMYDTIKRTKQLIKEATEL